MFNFYITQHPSISANLSSSCADNIGGGGFLRPTADHILLLLVEIQCPLGWQEFAAVCALYHSCANHKDDWADQHY
jgi:hypothetical protein